MKIPKPPFLLLLLHFLFLSSSFLQPFSSVLSQSPPPPPANTSPHGSSTTAFKVGVILGFRTPMSRITRTCINMAVSDFYAAHPNYTTRLLLHTRDSNRDAVAAASAAIDLLKNEQVHAIIGPQTSSEAEFLADLGNKAQVPIVSFSATSPSLSSAYNPYFIRTAPNDAFQAKSIAALVQAFGWRRVVPVYEDDDYATSLVPYLVDAFVEVDAQVPYRSIISRSATDAQMLEELYRLKTMQTRVFVVHMTTSLASRLFTNVKAAGMMSDGYAWIITDRLTSLLGTIDPSVVLDSMQGVLGVMPYLPRSKEFLEFRRRWRREFILEHPDIDIPELSAFGLWAYDTVWAMAMAAEATGSTDPQFDKPKPSNGSTDLATLGISKAGPKLLHAILNTEFHGLSGRFHLVDGQLDVSVFRVVNVIGEKTIEIGFWTARHGLSRWLSWTGEGGERKPTKDDLRPINWPGESMVLPKGWEMPTSERKLRIAVPGPVDPGFHSFLNVERNSYTNATEGSGFVVEVFEAAVGELPYALPFEFVPYRGADGKSAGDYNTLVSHVFNQNYDAVVGDVTITANRSRYVDFTLPYTVSGVSMVVPFKQKPSKNAWIFVKPLTTDLWLVSGAFFVFTAIVVWFLEHRINEAFRGPPAHQIGTVFYFSFSTLVFAHRENLVSNLSRFVVIIWVFVVLILTSSYTASLTSMLTVQQLQPTVTSFTDLKNSGAYVGHLKNSFVPGLLVKMGFDKNKLRPYRSPQEYAEALSNGSIAAIVDEVPYLKVFLRDYCENYTMTGETIKTAGFGFVFPKGSPLVPDLSRAILNITEGDKMAEIERRWFGDQTTCPNQGSTFSSNSLSFMSFWGLFLITGTASILSLFVYLGLFLHEHRHALGDHTASENPIWWRVRAMANLFDQKDHSSHTFRTDESKHGPDQLGVRDPTASPNGIGLESPMSMSNQTYTESGTPFVIGSPNPGETPPHLEMTVVRRASL